MSTSFTHNQTPDPENRDSINEVFESVRDVLARDALSAGSMEIIKEIKRSISNRCMSDFADLTIAFDDQEEEYETDTSSATQEARDGCSKSEKQPESETHTEKHSDFDPASFEDADETQRAPESPVAHEEPDEKRLIDELIKALDSADTTSMASLKRLVEIEGTSNKARLAVDRFGNTNLGMVRYARFNKMVGPNDIIDTVCANIGASSVRINIWKAAARDLADQSEKGKLTPEQINLAANLRIRLEIDGAKVTEDGEEASRDLKALDDALLKEAKDGQNDSVSNAIIKALVRLDAIDSITARRTLADIYLKTIAFGNVTKDVFQEQLKELKELGEACDEPGLKILVALTTSTDTPAAEQAARVLSEIVKSGADKPGSSSTEVKQTWSRSLRTQADENAMRPDSKSFKDAIRGLIQLGKAALWTPEDVKSFTNNLTPQIAEGIKDVFPHLSKQDRDLILDRITKIADNCALPNAKRRLALDTFKTVKNWSTEEQRSAVEAIQISETDTVSSIKCRDKENTIESVLSPGSIASEKAEKPLIELLVKQLGAPTALERSSAEELLSKYGPIVIRDLAVVANDSKQYGPDLATRAKEIIKSVMDDQTPVLTDKISELCKPAPEGRLDRTKLEEVIKTIDAPYFVIQRRNYLERLAILSANSPEASNRVRLGLTELQNIGEFRSQLKLRLAGEMILDGEDVEARKLLREALDLNPRLVKTVGSNGLAQEFSTLFMKAEGNGDIELTTTLERAGGTPRYLSPRPTAEMETAAKNLGLLQIGKVLDEGKALFKQFEEQSRPSLTSAERMKRMDELLRSPTALDQSEFVGLALDQYKSANNDFERNQALDSLRKGIQNGNSYSLEALRKLSTLDAALRLSEAMATIDSSDSEERKAEAKQRKDAALLDLARHEFAERQRDGQEFVGDAGGVMNYLAQRSETGMPQPRTSALEQVEQVRQQVVEEVQQRRTTFATTIQKVSVATGQSREASLQQLERLALDQIGKEFSLELNEAFKVIASADAIQDALNNIGDPQKVSDALIRLAVTERNLGDPNLQLVESLRKAGSNGEKLHKALLDGNRAEAERILSRPGVRQLINQYATPQEDLMIKLSSLQTGDVLKALQKPESLKELLSIAEQKQKGDQNRVLDLVDDYLLRTSPGQPARAALEQHLPPENGPFKLPDDAALKTLLQKAIDLKILPSRIAEHTRTLIEGKELSAKQVEELKQDLKVTDEERKQSSIIQLNKLSFDNLHTTYRFESVVKALESLDQGLSTTRSIVEANRLYNPTSGAGDEEKATAVAALVSNIEKMIMLAQDHYVTNEMLLEFQEKMDKEEGPKHSLVSHLKNVLDDLKGTDEDDEETRNKKIIFALKDLSTHFTDSIAKLDEYRAARIVSDLGPQSKPTDYERVTRQLQSEIEASVKEGGQANESAIDWQKWTKATASIARLTEAADTEKPKPEQAKEAVNELVREATKGNPYARAALSAVLVGDQHKSQLASWMRNHPTINGNRPIYVPNLQTMDGHVKHELLQCATNALLRIARVEKLTTEETAAVALALAKTTGQRADNDDPETNKTIKQTIQNLTETLKTAVTGKSAKESLIGIFEAIESDAKGCNVLAEIYLQGVGNPEFAKHFGQLKTFAKDFDSKRRSDRVIASLQIISGIAGGMADKNMTANPTRTYKFEGETITEVIDPIAERAAKALMLSADIPGARSSVVEAILSIQTRGREEAHFKDNNQRIAALGRIASGLPDGQSALRDKAMSAVREAALATSSTPNDASHRSAAKGLFAMVSHWQQADVDTVNNNLTDTMIRELQIHVDKISPQHQAEIIAKLVETISAGKEVDFATRLAAMKALAAFGKNLNEDQVSRLASFGGDASFNTAGNTVRKALQELKITGKPADKIHKAIANSENLDEVMKELELSTVQQDAIKKVLKNIKSGSQILEDLGIKGEHVNIFKSAVSECLLSVLIQAPHNLDGKEGPRELAFRSFRDLPWPIATGEIKEGKPVIIAADSEKNSKPSHANERLRLALLDYYRGKPIKSTDDVQLSAQINRIVDGAMLPRPSALIIQSLGILGSPIESFKPGDPPTVVQIAERIEKNNTRVTGSKVTTGQDVLRNVVANIEMVNALPGHLRAKLMGWDDLITAKKEFLGFVEPTDSQKMELNWKSLSEDDKSAIRWQRASDVDARVVLGQMYNTEKVQDKEVTVLENSEYYKALLKDLSNDLEGILTKRCKEINDNHSEVRQLHELRKKLLEDFVKRTEKGANFGNQITGLFTGNNGRDAVLNAEQTRLATQLNLRAAEIKAGEQVIEKLEQKRAGIELSQSMREYIETLNKGDQKNADEMAIRLWTEHGVLLAKLTRLWHDLTISSDTTLQGASILRRHNLRGTSHWDLIPGYTSGVKPGSYYDRSKALQGIREALGLNAAYSTPELQTIERLLPLSGKLDPDNRELKAALTTAVNRKMLSPQAIELANLFTNPEVPKSLTETEMNKLRSSLCRGLLQLDRIETNKIDAPALRRHIFGRIDSDPTLLKFSSQSRAMGDDLNELSKMVDAATKGSVYEGSIALMKEKAQRIKNALNGDEDSPITRQDLFDLSERIKVMEVALEQFHRNPNAHNEQAIKDLESRIKNYKNIHNLFNKFDDKPLYRDENGNLTNQHKQVDQMLNRILDGGLSAATLTTWFKENGAMIGITIGACAATVAACATFGVSSPAAVGAWVAVGGLAARESTQEILFQINKDGYTGVGSYDNKGARIGDWNRRAYRGVFKSESEALGHILTDVAGPYAVEATRDWLAFVATAGILNRVSGMTSSEAVKSLFQATPPKNIAQLASQSERLALLESNASLNPIAKSYLKQFMRELSSEILLNTTFTAAQLGLETGIHKAIGHEGVEAMGEWGQFGLSFALSTALAMGQGAMHSRIFRHGSWEPGKTFRFKLEEGVTEIQMVKYMRQQGLLVEQVSPGKWRVLPLGATPGLKPIVMEDTTRGEARPPAGLHPDAHTPTKQEARTESKVINESSEWTASEKGRKALELVDKFTEAFMAGDMDTALKLATRIEELAPGSKMKPIWTEHTFDHDAFKAAPPERQVEILRDYMEILSRFGRATDRFGLFPEIIVKIDGHDFNLRTGEPVDNTITPPEQTVKAFKEFLTSQAGKRLLAEHALTAMEEKLHLLQNQMNNEAYSSEYVKFKRDRGEWSERHFNGTDRDGVTGRDSKEQEIILALYERGWSVEMLEHHFGGHHRAARADAFNWIRSQEALNKPNSTSGLKLKAELEALQSQGIDRVKLENAVRAGRLTPEDVETLNLMISKEKLIAVKELNGYLEDMTKHEPKLRGKILARKFDIALGIQPKISEDWLSCVYYSRDQTVRVGHEGNLTRVTINDLPVRIGRNPRSEVKVDDALTNVADRHGFLFKDDGGVYFENMSTQDSNPCLGTWVRTGTEWRCLKYRERVYLKNVDEIWIGGQPDQGGQHLWITNTPTEPLRTAELIPNRMAVEEFAGAHRTLTIDGQEYHLYRSGLWFEDYTTSQTDPGHVKVHVAISDPHDLVRVQSVLIPALKRDPALRTLVESWKTMDPYYATSQSTSASGVRPDGTGQGAKGFTLYCSTPEQARLIQARVSEILDSAGLALPTPHRSGNVERLDNRTQRVGIVRDSWPAASLPRAFLIDRQVETLLHLRYSVESGKQLTATQRASIEQALGLAPDSLVYDSDGRLALLGTSNARPYNGLTYAPENGYTPQGLRDRPALYRLYHHVGLDPSIELTAP